MNAHGQPRVAFVVGCQRSGTTLMIDLLDRSPDVEAHGEGSPQAMRGYRLVSVDRLRDLIGTSPRPVVAFKPICDSQWTDVLLAEIDGSRAIWLYRNWWEVARSATRAWPGHFVETAARFRAGDESWLEWRTERVDTATRDGFARLLEHAQDDFTAAAAFWWLRNRLPFDLGLDRHPELVWPVRYRRLVTTPDVVLRRLFGRLGLSLDPAIAADVHANSTRGGPPAGVPAPLADACDELLEALDRLPR